ncbi:hypothetical protein F5Y10DRAFT_293025 [Nemania abortiva]|nr:hypothetical protein F5Y10DRAFT_293025 [Nemania abortiva]
MDDKTDDGTKKALKLQVEPAGSASENRSLPKAYADNQDSSSDKRADAAVQREAGSIRLMVRSCGEDFEKTLNLLRNSRQVPLTPQIISVIEELRQRFDAWADHARIFARNRSRLDHRIRDRSAHKTTFIRSLTTVQQALHIVGTHGVPGAAQGFTGNGADACSDLSDEGKRDSRLNRTFSIIDETIGDLTELTNRIKFSSTSTITARARIFASRNPNLMRLDDFEEKALLAVYHLYPNASEALRQHVANTMTDRYAKLQYGYHGMQKARENSISNTTIDKSSSSPDTKEKRSSLEDESTCRKAVGKDIQNRGHAVTFPSVLDANLLVLMTTIPEPELRPPKAILSEYIGQVSEPQTPNFDNEDFVDCEWCFQPIPRSFTRMKGNGAVEWTAEGRDHYRRDLHPYVCLDVDCWRTRPSFSSSGEWREHMTWSHSKYWLANLHNEPIWRCTAKHGYNSLYMFPTQYELLRHVRLQHHDSPNDDADAIREYGTRSHLPASCCPFCLFCVDNPQHVSNDDLLYHETSHKGKRRLISPGSSEKRVKLGPSNAMFHKKPISRAMILHIQEHLYHLMIVSLNLKSSMNDVSLGASSTQRKPDPTGSRISTPSDGQLHGKPEDLITESLSWISESSSIRSAIDFMEMDWRRLEDPDADVKQAALNAFTQQPRYSDDIFASVKTQLMDENSRVRFAALVAIRARLDHEEIGVRRAALDALSPYLPKEVFQSVASLLKERDEGVTPAVLLPSPQFYLTDKILQATAEEPRATSKGARYVSLSISEVKGFVSKALIKSGAADVGINYMTGSRHQALKNHVLAPRLAAFTFPGEGDTHIIESTQTLCMRLASEAFIRPTDSELAFFEIGSYNSDHFEVAFGPNRESKIDVHSEDTLLCHLKHLGIYYNLLGLAYPESGLGILAEEIAVPSGGAPGNAEILTEVDCLRKLDGSEPQQNESICIRVRNRTLMPLYIEMLNLQPSWEATRVYPVADSTPGEILPGECADYFLQMPMYKSAIAPHVQPSGHNDIIVLASENRQGYFQESILPKLGDPLNWHDSPFKVGNSHHPKGLDLNEWYAQRVDVRVVNTFIQPSVE